MAFVPDDIAHVFAERLALATRYRLRLPKRIREEVVFHPITDDDADDTLSAVALQIEGEWVLDYFALKRPGFDEYSAHVRIRADGTSVALENFEGQFGHVVTDDEAADEREWRRMARHNAKVQRILSEKGLA